ncbi:YkgJ family cysteine cluster protein [uncultured Eubacterium sp.]|uniref:YkgJ family cysteine cluster protein n=1 Tax=uncultured Eubacterium sp. TaxID=165185 RepID=UPI0025E6D2B2|nr:YkgJ family cysteine cluster protein [uncultured Eubacterium sp.]
MEEYLKDISDGKLYSSNDMVKVGCHDCTGCSACCCDMGESILLDPMDVWRLERNLGQSFEQLLAGAIDLHVEDGLILPNLKMTPSATGPKCSFLNEEGRCSIHAFRPGICRLFPLGRNYDGENLSYFLLTDACPAKNKSKMKVSKWLEMDGMKDYERFLVKWHALTKSLRQIMQNCDEEEAKRKNMLFLQMFYFTPVQQENFYDGFYERLEQFERR